MNLLYGEVTSTLPMSLLSWQWYLPTHCCSSRDVNINHTFQPDHEPYSVLLWVHLQLQLNEQQLLYMSMMERSNRIHEFLSAVGSLRFRTFKHTGVRL